MTRVEASFADNLANIAERLFDETRVEYSFSAIVRGLLRQGLINVDEMPLPELLAPMFEGTRLSRGRKRGSRWSGFRDLDLTANDEVLDLEFEDEHNDKLERGVIVARGRRPPREKPAARHAEARGGASEESRKEEPANEGEDADP